MKIEIANIEDVPEILNLQYLTETVEHTCGEFPKYTTLKMLSGDGKIIGSVRGRVEDGSLYIGRLIVLPEFQKNGYGRILLRKIQSVLPHSRAWLDTSGDVPETVSFYEREGFRTFESKRFENGVSWIFMERK